MDSMNDICKNMALLGSQDPLPMEPATPTTADVGKSVDGLSTISPGTSPGTTDAMSPDLSDSAVEKLPNSGVSRYKDSDFYLFDDGSRPAATRFNYVTVDDHVTPTGASTIFDRDDENDADLVTADLVTADYGSATLEDVVDENMTDTIFSNFTAAQGTVTAWSNTTGNDGLIARGDKTNSTVISDDSWTLTGFLQDRTTASLNTTNYTGVTDWVNTSYDLSSTSAVGTLNSTSFWWTGQLVEATTEYDEPLPRVNRTNYTALIGEFFDDFEYVSETYLMTTLAVLGIILNTLGTLATCRDRQMRRMTRVLHCLFFSAENVFLAGIVAFVQLRGFERRQHLAKEHDYELKNYYTTFFGIAQATAAWMLYFVATDAYRGVAKLVSTTPGVIAKKIKRLPYHIAGVVVLILAFYSAYLPPVRVLMFRLHKYAFSMCNVPFENHWDFRIREVERENLFYILYYSLAFLIVTHAMPFFAIACRDKDVIDALHHSQDVLPMLQEHVTHQTLADVEELLMLTKKQRGSLIKKHSEAGSYALTERQSSIMCSALSVSVICNMYLVCAALKVVILTFKIFTFGDDFVYGTAVVFFRYLNVYSNCLLIVKSCLHFCILMMYNIRLRYVVMAMLVRCCPLLQRRKFADDDDEDYDEDEDDDGANDEDKTKQDAAKCKEDAQT